MFLVTPPNYNIERCVKIIYNNIQIIHSPDNIYSSISKFWADHPSRKILVALKNLFLYEDLKRFEQEYKLFNEIYVDNKLITLLLDKRKSDIEKFYENSCEMRHLFYPFYTIHEMKKYLNKLKTKEPLCTKLNEVIKFCLPLINSFEMGRNYSKSNWLNLISTLYNQYKDEMEDYFNV